LSATLHFGNPGLSVARLDVRLEAGQKLRRHARALAFGKLERLFEHLFRGRGHRASVPPLVNPGKPNSATGGAAEGLLHRIAQDPLGQAPVQARKARGRAVIDRENEAEVDRLPEASRVLDERLPDRPLVAAECAVAWTDPVQLVPLSVRSPSSRCAM
jgi:hypothetical protein